MGIKVKIHLQSAEMQHVLFAPCLNAPHQFVLVLRDHHTAAIVIRYCVLKCLSRLGHRLPPSMLSQMQFGAVM
jgi:hypothetical protein